MTLVLPNLVSTDWLADHLDEVTILDGTYTLPGVSPTGPELYAAAHIPGARFFDIDAVSDKAQPLPHMLPSPDAFAKVAEGLGLRDGAPVVVYDTQGLFSAARVWWTLRVFGHDNVAVLNGGLRKWQAEGREVTTEVPAPAAGRFTPAFRPHLVADRGGVLANLESGAAQVIDARPAARFTGSAPEARPGLRSGHIPGSLNLPSTSLTDPATGEVLPLPQIEALLRSAGYDAARPVVASCGSGVTAGTLAFALALLGRDDVAVYDGSWAEWGQPGETPVATGA